MKAFPLQTVLELMQTRMDEATNRLAQLIANEKNEKNKLEMLQDYRHEYAMRFHEASLKGLTPNTWKNYREFLGSLDEAIKVQEKVLEQQARNTRRGQKQWKEQQKKLKAFDTLAERHNIREKIRESRLEQRNQDEFAIRLKK